MSTQHNIDALEASRKLEQETMERLLLTKEPNIETLAFHLGIMTGLGIAINVAKASEGGSVDPGCNCPVGILR